MGRIQHCLIPWRLGGICSYGPVSLLSGLNPCPLHLFLHFFAAAIYGVGRLMLPFPSPKRMWLGFLLILSASHIIFSLLSNQMKHYVMLNKV
ncbi:squalene monooxygenase SE1-like [Rosa rugosa]|uniref:squalene monooxygenase SE1-like n=1 Tax=Rosa rugosa TaxID=74645 RepID=UPI002B411B7B|nr:squalene monooxygenase SE1-like [Rosa rugosa]